MFAKQLFNIDFEKYNKAALVVHAAKSAENKCSSSPVKCIGSQFAIYCTHNTHENEKLQHRKTIYRINVRARLVQVFSTLSAAHIFPHTIKYVRLGLLARSLREFSFLFSFTNNKRTKKKVGISRKTWLMCISLIPPSQNHCRR